MNKQSKTPKEILEENIIQGKIAEEIAKQDYIRNGFVTHGTGIGSDFIAEKKIDNRIYQVYVDVKSGKSKLTKKQKQIKNKLKRQKIQFDEYRVTDKHLEFQIKNNSELQKFCLQMEFDISKFTGMQSLENVKL